MRLKNFQIVGIKDLVFLTFMIGVVFFLFMLLFEPIHAIPILRDLLPGYRYESFLTLIEDFIPTFTLLSGIASVLLILFGIWRYWK